MILFNEILAVVGLEGGFKALSLLAIAGYIAGMFALARHHRIDNST